MIRMATTFRSIELLKLDLLMVQIVISVHSVVYYVTFLEEMAGILLLRLRIVRQ